MKVSELTGIALDWAVAMCEFDKAYADYCFKVVDQYGQPRYSTDWALGGLIIEREGIDVYCTLIGRPNHKNISWQKSNWRARYSRMGTGSDASFGHSALEAAMRCYCCSKLGDEIEIPEELL